MYAAVVYAAVPGRRPPGSDARGPRARMLTDRYLSIPGAPVRNRRSGAGPDPAGRRAGERRPAPVPAPRRSMHRAATGTR